jgi:hypothetical protein
MCAGEEARGFGCFLARRFPEFLGRIGMRSSLALPLVTRQFTGCGEQPQLRFALPGPSLWRVDADVRILTSSLAQTEGYQVADPKQDESFKVVDRRLFTEEGELRKDAVEQERRDEEAASVRKASAQKAAKPAAATSDSAAPAPLAETAPTDAAPADATDSIAPSRSFQMLVDFLTRNAAAMLGGMADPRTGQPFLDLEGAREMIDMLDVLREKTRGNIAKTDEDLLIEVVGSLKLTFMEVSKAAAEAMANKAGKR